jgi:hypothetical protein
VENSPHELKKLKNDKKKSPVSLKKKEKLDETNELHRKKRKSR